MKSDRKNHTEDVYLSDNCLEIFVDQKSDLSSNDSGPSFWRNLLSVQLYCENVTVMIQGKLIVVVIGCSNSIQTSSKKACKTWLTKLSRSLNCNLSLN